MYRGDIAMQYATTAEQIADIFNKALDPVTFIKFRDRLVVSKATFNIIEKVFKMKEPEKKKRKI